MKSFSLRLRLIILFSLLAAVTWCIASGIAWWQTRQNINEVFDTQQMLFAKRLATVDVAAMLPNQQLPKTKKIVHHGSRGKLDDDALAFAIFDRQGRMLLNDGENGKDFIFIADREGFTDGKLRGDNDRWRFVWLTTTDQRYRIAVGQEQDYRQDMALNLVTGQLWPWLASLPILMILIALIIGRELKPLRRVADELQLRAPDDASEISPGRVPVEARPLVVALNALFTRTQQMLLRERRFTSDAAHELRSPLTALRVQTEVVQLSGDDPVMREHALNNLTCSIDRATRLIDQLLTLSRLESFSDLQEVEVIDWPSLVGNTLAEQEREAYRTGIDLRFDVKHSPASGRGQALLLSLLVRNLVDNAIRYTPAGGEVRVTLTAHELCIEDSGPGITAEHLARLGERFYRPPGQEQTGSGLGLSIVKRIADLHGLRVDFSSPDEGGFHISLQLEPDIVQ